ncbi:MAG: hypothetical protein ACYDBW_11865 [Sulfuricaulis sp.]
MNPDTPSPPSEGGRRLRAAVRTVLSPGIWLVLTSQFALAFSLHWRPAETASAEASALPILLTTTLLLLFLYLQASAFQALARSREAVSAADVVRAGRAIFSAFIWLTLKAGLSLVLILNLLIYLSLLVSGHDFKSVIEAISPWLGPLVGILAFAFVYWLPFVFVRGEFRLLPSLKASLRIARARLSHAGFLVLLVLVPVVVSAFLPAKIPVLLDFAVSVVSGILGWMAYIYCVEAVQEFVPETRSDTVA